MSRGCCCIWSIMCLLQNLAKSKFWPNFLLWNSKKEIAFCESRGRELSFEWPQHRILSADSKVTFTLQNSIKNSGSERVKSQIFSIREITKISSKSQQAALPITIVWVIFAGLALKKKKKKKKKKPSKSWANTVLIRVHPCHPLLQTKGSGFNA